MTQGKRTTSTSKVRRRVRRSKPTPTPPRCARIRRPDPRAVHIRATETTLTAVAGLVGFGVFLRELGVDAELRRTFGRLKPDSRVLYPMAAQMRLLIDAAAAAEARVFGLEALANDPLFVHLAGGVVPSIDTVYRDLGRFDDEALAARDTMLAQHGFAPLAVAPPAVVHLDVDTTVEPLFGSQEGARPGPNPRYQGRPSYHPLLVRVAETNTVIGARLRPGDTSFGNADVPYVEGCLDRVRAAAPEAAVYVRIDAAGDCTHLLPAIADKGAFFLTRPRLTRDLAGAISLVTRWKTVDWDADGRPRRQVAEVPFRRGEWGDLEARVIAVRTLDRTYARHIYLWDDLDYTVQVYLTNEMVEAPEDVAARYDPRAGIEVLIRDLKHGWGCGQVPSHAFAANHAMLLLKLLTHNLMRRYVLRRFPELSRWTAPWLRRELILVPGRLLRGPGRERILRVPELSLLGRRLN
ncbi:IS1380 family transposase [Sorangium sp. So ce1024]|uniref:IS1380 family transposase n=1 Tax=Sorangium sp. So ce1024 TaxID=3133327 RepID=UPI003F527169